MMKIDFDVYNNCGKASCKVDKKLLIYKKTVSSITLNISKVFAKDKYIHVISLDIKFSSMVHDRIVVYPSKMNKGHAIQLYKPNGYYNSVQYTEITDIPEFRTFYDVITTNIRKELYSHVARKS